ncbi:MAG: SpoIID/LytB domain-containing protein [Candidatus Omnitrophica bacterium]|nr:SpoIID/LytB domain-containing protein [Candidatus Omnitrophota bacterium]
MRKRAFFILAYLFAMFCASSAVALDAGSDPIVVRVSIMDDKDSVYLSVKDAYKIYAINSDRVLMSGPRLATNISATKDGLMVGAKELKMGGISVKAEGKTRIYVGGRLFRGDVDIIRKENNKLMLINHIGLEDYLYGVLYHEVSHRWPMEALKSQAIAARTFALYQARQNKMQPYDLRSDIYSQVYGGSTSERWSTTMAVNVTKGKILVYNGDILPAYYHATCAGSTEDAANLWKVDIPPLKGVICNFCVRSPHYKWTKEVPLWSLENKLRENSYKIDKIASVNILSRNESGRVDKMEIKDSAGVSILLTGKDFRQIMGPNELRSTKFEASIKYGSLMIEGRGWGHGVGMCQWGAFSMASQGKKAEDILKFYYPGAEIATIDSVKSKL